MICGQAPIVVARLLAQMYQAMGLLRRGHVVEVDRAGLVGQWVGSTAAKTDRVIRQALDGLLFIHEVPTLEELRTLTDETSAAARAGGFFRRRAR